MKVDLNLVFNFLILEGCSITGVMYMVSDLSKQHKDIFYWGGEEGIRQLLLLHQCPLPVLQPIIDCYLVSENLWNSMNS